MVKECDKPVELDPAAHMRSEQNRTRIMSEVDSLRLYGRLSINAEMNSGGTEPDIPDLVREGMGQE